MSTPANDSIPVTTFLEPKELAAMAAAARESAGQVASPAPTTGAKTEVLRAVGGVITRPMRYAEQDGAREN